MYEVDELDRAVEVSGFPLGLAAAPYPRVLATERDLWLAYDCLNSTDDPDADRVAVITFTHAPIHLFGTYTSHNNPEHPLFGRGLKFYGVFTVENSSFVRVLQGVHAAGPDAKHYIVTFHDSIFECIANGFALETLRPAEAQAILSGAVNG